jgi:hypothetical protein
MYSFSLLLSIWFFLIGVFSRSLTTEARNQYLVPLLFLLASMCQFSLAYFLIVAGLPPILMARLCVLIAILLATISISLPSLRSSIYKQILEFFIVLSPNDLMRSSRQEGLFYKLRAGLIIIAILLICVTQLLTPTVYNWDSNWFNLSRIPVMIIERSVFPDQSPSLYQVLHPISHDLLYLPDIVFVSLRGMGLIASVEFFIALGALYSITNCLLTSSGLKSRQGIVQLALLIVTILFLSSDLQVLQSADPKNDLAVLMAFLISLSMCINKEFRVNSPIIYFLSLAVVIVYAVSSKVYGMIAIVPPLAAMSFDGLSTLKCTSLSNWQTRLKVKVKAYATDVCSIAAQNWLLLAFASLVTIFTAITYVHHVISIVDSTYADRLMSMAAEHSNTHGSLGERTLIFYLNIIRNSVAFLLYPYTTLLKPNALRPNDYILGFGPLTTILNDPRGVLNGPTIVRTIKADAAFGSILLVPLLGILFAVLFYQLLKSRSASGCSASLKQRNSAMLIDFFSSESTIIVILSSLTCFMFFSWSLYSQTFLSKYLGSTFVPWIPILGAGLALLYNPKMRVHSIALLLCTTYAILRLGFLLNVGLVPNFVNNLFRDPTSLKVAQSPNLLYYQYVRSRYTPEQASRWLSSLAKLPSNKTHVLCFGSDTATLTPLMYAIQSLNTGRVLEFRLVDPARCKTESIDPAIDMKKTDFINFF